MQRFLACLAILCVGGLAQAAATGPPSSAPARPVPEVEAENYAHELLRISQDIAHRFVRPVSQADLLAAALVGLHDAARIPMPPGIAVELEQAAKKWECAAITTAGADQQMAQSAEASFTDGEYYKIVRRARESLGNPEALQGQAALLASIRGMMRCLDQHSCLVNGSDLLRGTGREINFGAGLELVENSGNAPLLIKTVVPGGPAQRAGLRPGDEVTHLDGQPVKGIPSDQAVLLLNRPTGLGVIPAGFNSAPAVALNVGAGTVELTLRRASAPAPWKVKLDRREYHAETVLGVVRRADNSWDYFVDRQRKIAHLRIAGLGAHTPEDLRDVLEDLQKQGVRGVILDLRWCPGGLLKSAVDVAAVFVKTGKIAVVKTRVEGETVYGSESDVKVLDLPMVVLINGDTSGGAELIAAALQDHQRARLAGQRSLGKGNIQTMIALPIRDAGLKVTSGTFLRPSGKPLHRSPESKPSDDWGVRPDAGLEFRLSADLSRQLRERWLRQTLRPGGSTEALPLDDPEADPQRAEALQLLK